MNELLLNEAIYQRVIAELVPATRKFLWITTADIKDLHVGKGLIQGSRKNGGKKQRFVPFLEILSDLVQQGVAIRLIHAKEPGVRFRKDFDKYPALIESDLFERILCPRVHTKAIIIDGETAFVTSANLTGAGLGAKSPHRRNFEAGILSDQADIVQPLIEWIDALYLGDYCQKCQRREFCPDPIA